MEEELQQMKQKLDESENSEEQEDEQVSRRDFLKKLGAGAAGIGALSLPGVSAFDIKSSDGLEVFESGTKYLDVQPGGPVEVNNTGLTITGSASTTSKNSELYLKSNDPQIEFYDTNESSGNPGRRYWFHQNSGKFYLLQDRSDDGGWNSPHPFTVETDGVVDFGFTPTASGASLATQNWVSGTHSSNSSAHHSRYTDSEAVSAGQNAGFTDMGNYSTNGSRDLKGNGGGRLFVTYTDGSGNPDRVVMNYSTDYPNGVEIKGNLTNNGNTVLTTADEGSGNGLNADKVDGKDVDEIGSDSKIANEHFAHNFIG